MFVSDIYDELKTADVLGICNDDVIFRRLTDAVRLLANQGILDPSIGEMSLCVYEGCVTLPSDVQTVLAVNQGGNPTLLRDEWFQYHANGSGTSALTDWNYTDVLGGNFCTYRDPANAVALIANVENPKDSNCLLRVFGWDSAGRRIYSADANNTMQDGFYVPTVYGFHQSNPNVPLIARIERIQKAVTNGFVTLLAVNQDGTPHTTIGQYRPEETVPRYTRVRVADRNWLKIKYKKRNFEVRSTSDWINVDNREALLLAVKAVQQRRKNNTDLAKQLESEASRILLLEAQSNRPPGISPIQVVWSEGLPAGVTDTLFY